MLLHFFIIAWSCATLFLILSRKSEFLSLLSRQNVNWSYFCSGVKTSLVRHPVWADLCGPPTMATAPASVPVCSSEGTPWTERMDPCEQRKDTLPHGGLQINDWGSHALQAFMHHTQFTDKHVTKRSRWEFQGFPALVLIGSQHWCKPTQRQRQTGLGVVGRGLTVWLHT